MIKVVFITGISFVFYYHGYEVIAMMLWIWLFCYLTQIKSD